MTEDRENKIIEERIKGWTAFEYEKFLNEIDREIEKIRKKTKATDKELEIGYKILSPAPTACFIDPVIFMHEKYDEMCIRDSTKRDDTGNRNKQYT